MNISNVATLYQPFFTETLHGYKIFEINAVIFPFGGTFMNGYSTEKPTSFTEYHVEVGNILYDRKDKKYYTITKRKTCTSETDFLFFELDIKPLSCDSK